MNCHQTGCTVASTGTCLLSHADASLCPNHVDNDEVEATNPSTSANLTPIPVIDAAARTFSAGLELGLEEATELMRSRYAHVVGILGSYDAGKTCMLISLYLLAASAMLSTRFAFAGCRTLEGFEQRAHRVRDWKKGALPPQLADHTSLGDSRQAAFLHLTLADRAEGMVRRDVLLNDVPGEWTKDLIERSLVSGRWEFLARSDSIVLVLDGPLFASHMKHVEFQRAKHLLDRLIQTVGIDTSVPIAIVVSKSDLLEMTCPPLIESLDAYAKTLGLHTRVFQCVAFSSKPESFRSGTGLDALLQYVFDWQPQKETVKKPGTGTTNRFFHSFGMRT